MAIDHLTTTKRSVNKFKKDASVPKPANKANKSQLVLVTQAEINAIRPSVYKYLLP